jgi:hypothetical protein
LVSIGVIAKFNFKQNNISSCYCNSFGSGGHYSFASQIDFSYSTFVDLVDSNQNSDGLTHSIFEFEDISTGTFSYINIIGSENQNIIILFDSLSRSCNLTFKNISFIKNKVKHIFQSGRNSSSKSKITLECESIKYYSNSIQKSTFTGTIFPSGNCNTGELSPQVTFTNATPQSNSINFETIVQVFTSSTSSSPTLSASSASLSNEFLSSSIFSSSNEYSISSFFSSSYYPQFSLNFSQTSVFSDF